MHMQLPAELMERHRAFWAMEPVDRPLLRIGRYRELQPRQPFVLTDGTLVSGSGSISPERLDLAILAEQSGQPSQSLSGDFLLATAPYDLCWMEAILGCTIRWRHGSPWSEAFLTDAEELDIPRPQQSNPWFQVLMYLADLLVRRAAGGYAVTQPLLRGPIDMAAAALEDEPLCWLMLGEPEPFHDLLTLCTDVFIEVATAWISAVPRFADGTCIYGIWAPGTVVRTQCDNAALMSPRLYQEFLVPCDERICASFDYPLIHTHSCFVDMVADALLGIDALRAIQVSIDYPGGPTVDELMPTFRQINTHKPLVITGPVSQIELDRLLAELSPTGLCLQVDLYET